MTRKPQKDPWESVYPQIHIPEQFGGSWDAYLQAINKDAEEKFTKEDLAKVAYMTMLEEDSPEHAYIFREMENRSTAGKPTDLRILLNELGGPQGIEAGARSSITKAGSPPDRRTQSTKQGSWQHWLPLLAAAGGAGIGSEIGMRRMTEGPGTNGFMRGMLLEEMLEPSANGYVGGQMRTHTGAGALIGGAVGSIPLLLSKLKSKDKDPSASGDEESEPNITKVGSCMVLDFVEHLRKEAGAKPRARGYQGGHDFKTTNQIAGARAMHGAKPPRTATAEEMRPHQQYGGYDWSNYRSDMGNDLSGTWGASSGPGYMESINGGRDAVLARGGDLSAMGVTPLQAAPSPTAIPAAGNASYTPPVSGGALGGQSYPAPGSPEYAAAVQRQARGSDDYRAARNGAGRMGFKPDGSWGLVTPAMEGQPIQRTATAPAPTAQTTPQPVAQTAPQPVAQTAPQPVAQTAPSPATQTAPAPMAQTAPPTGPDPFDSRTTGPGQFNNLPPSPFGFDGSGEVDPFQGPSRPVADYDPFNMTTGPDQYTGVPESPAGFGPAPSGPAIDFPGTSPLNVTTGPNQFTGLPQSPAGFGGAPRPYTGESPFNTTTGPNQFTGLPPSPAGFDVRNLLSSPWAGVDPRFQQPRPMNPWQSLYGLNA